MKRKISDARASIEDPRVPLSASNIIAFLGLDGLSSEAGINVTADKAMEVPAVWCAVNFIADTIAALPLHLYRRDGDGGRRRIRSRLAIKLHDAPNPELTSFRWRSDMMANVLLSGRGYTFIERNAGGQAMNLWPLEPSKVTVSRREGRKEYVYKPSRGGEITYAAREIIDVPFRLAADGLSHRDPVLALRNAIGLTIALEAYASRFFQNGGVPPLALSGPIATEQGAKRASSDIIRALAEARDERRNVLVLPTGHELKALGIDPDKMQMTDARRFQIEEVGRIYNLPPVFLQDLTHGTFSNTEQQDLHFVKHTLSKWIEAIEQEINLKIFGAGASRFVEFNQDGLLRGDFKTRMEGYGVAIQNGLRTPNEIRAENNWEPKEGGDSLFIQSATVPLAGQRPAGTGEE